MSLYVHQSGRVDTPSIIFLHGLGLSGAMWQPQFQRLPDYHCLVVNTLRSGRVWPPNVEHCPQSWILGQTFLDKTASHQVHLLSNL